MQKLLCNFIENALWHGRSPVNVLYIFRTRFSKNTSGVLLLLRGEAVPPRTITAIKSFYLNSSYGLEYKKKLHK